MERVVAPTGLADVPSSSTTLGQLQLRLSQQQVETLRNEASGQQRQQANVCMETTWFATSTVVLRSRHAVCGLQLSGELAAKLRRTEDAVAQMNEIRCAFASSHPWQCLCECVCNAHTCGAASASASASTPTVAQHCGSHVGRTLRRTRVSGAGACNSPRDRTTHAKCHRAVPEASGDHPAATCLRHRLHKCSGSQCHGDGRSVAG